MFTMMNNVAFFSVRAPRTSLFQDVNGGSCQSISYSSPLSKSISLSETLQIRVSHTLKIMNWQSIAIISVKVVPIFMHSHLPKSKSFGLRWRSLLPSIQSQTSINGSLPLFVLAFFIQNLFWFIFLVIFTSVSQVCKIFYNSLEADIIHLRNRSLLLKMRAFLHFSFSLSGIRLCSLKMSCIWSCYLWWIMSRHRYWYSRKQGSCFCFWWRRNQSGGVTYLFWTHACRYSW